MNIPNKDSERSVREILLSIERTVNAQKEALRSIPSREDDAGPAVRTLHYPKPLSEPARDAISMVLDDVASKGVKIGYKELIDQVNQIEPGCLRNGGDVNDQIRHFCAMRCGIETRWARS